MDFDSVCCLLRLSEESNDGGVLFRNMFILSFEIYIKGSDFCFRGGKREIAVLGLLEEQSYTKPPERTITCLSCA